MTLDLTTERVISKGDLGGCEGMGGCGCGCAQVCVWACMDVCVGMRMCDEFSEFLLET